MTGLEVRQVRRVSGSVRSGCERSAVQRYGVLGVPRVPERFNGLNGSVFAAFRWVR